MKVSDANEGSGVDGAFAVVLPAPSDHSRRNWSKDSLHHGEMLLVLMSLQITTDEHMKGVGGRRSDPETA